MHHPSVSRHIVPVNCSNWNIICIGQKESINAQVFRLLSALMKVHPLLQAIETARSGFIQILHHCSVPWKMIPLYFFSSNLIYFGQKYPMEVKLLDFWVVGWKFNKFRMPYFKPQVSFSSTFVWLFSVMRNNFSVLFSWNFTWF